MGPWPPAWAPAHAPAQLITLKESSSSRKSHKRTKWQKEEEENEKMMMKAKTEYKERTELRHKHFCSSARVT